MVSAFFEFWDQVELALVTLPFALQIVVMLGIGVPLFALVARGVQWIADRLVRVARVVGAGEATEAYATEHEQTMTRSR